MITVGDYPTELVTGLLLVGVLQIGHRSDDDWSAEILRRQKCPRQTFPGIKVWERSQVSITVVPIPLPWSINVGAAIVFASQDIPGGSRRYCLSFGSSYHMPLSEINSHL